MSEVPFPELSPSEIIQYLAGFQMTGITEDDIRKPQSDTSVLYELYRWFTMQITQCDERNLDQPPFNPEDEGLDPDLYIVGQQRMMLVSGLDVLFTDICDSKQYEIRFTMRDLTHPQPKKVIRNLSLLISFHSTMMERQEAVAKIMAQYNGRIEKKNGMLEEMDKLKNEINKLTAEKAKNQPKIKQLTEEKLRAKKEMDELLKKTESVKKELEAMDLQQSSELGALKETEATVQALRDKEKLLDEQIVVSPERLEATMGELRGQTSQAERTLRELDETLVDMRERHQNFTAIASSLDSLLADMKACQDEHQEIERLKATKIEAEERLDLLKHKVDDGRLTATEKRNILESKQDQLQTLKRTHGAKIAEMEKEIQRLTDLLNEAEIHREQEEIVAIDFQEKCAELRQRIERQKFEYQGHSEKLEKKYMEVFRAIENSDNQAHAFYDHALNLLGDEMEPGNTENSEDF